MFLATIIFLVGFYRCIAAVTRVSIILQEKFWTESMKVKLRGFLFFFLIIILGLVFFVLNSLLGIERQWSRSKFAILIVKPHVRISVMHRTWAISYPMPAALSQSWLKIPKNTLAIQITETKQQCLKKWAVGLFSNE